MKEKGILKNNQKRDFNIIATWLTVKAVLCFSKMAWPKTSVSCDDHRTCLSGQGKCHTRAFCLSRDHKTINLSLIYV